MSAKPAPKRESWINSRTAQNIIPLDNAQAGATYPSAEVQEHQLVGAILTSGELGKGNDMYKRVRYLKQNDFFTYEIGYVWRAFERIVEDGRQIDLVTVEGELNSGRERNQPILQIIGGKTFLLRLMQQAGANIESYAQDIKKASAILYGKAEIRKLDRVLDNGMALSFHDLGVTVDNSMKSVRGRINAFNQRNTENFADAAERYMERAIEEAANPQYLPGIQTGYPGFDKVTLGLAKNKLYIFAAPPGWGKTAWLLCLALICLNQGKKVLFLSLEMSIDEMVERMMCISARVDYSQFRKRKWSAEDGEKLRKERERIRGLKESKSFTMVEMRKPTLGEIEAKLIDHQISPGYDIVFIDYIALNTMTPPKPHDDANQNALAIGTELERWKKSYDAPFCVATQMNQKWNSRKGKRPELGDLYYGSSLGFGADFVGFIYHESKVKPKSPNRDSEIVVRKNRCGPGGDNLKLMFSFKQEWLLFYVKQGADDMEPMEQGEDDDE